MWIMNFKLASSKKEQTMKPYKVGIAGLRRSVGPAQIFGVLPDCEVAAGCDLDPVALEYFGKQFPGAKLFTNYQ